jgi:polysaccharide biosynthesis protein PslH
LPPAAATTSFTRVPLPTRIGHTTSRAAACGKAIVSTHIGAEGLGMVSEQHAVLVDRPREFAAACLRLIRDDALVDRLGHEARELAAAKYDKTRIVRSLARSFVGEAIEC